MDTFLVNIASIWSAIHIIGLCHLLSTHLVSYPMLKPAIWTLVQLTNIRPKTALRLVTAHRTRNQSWPRNESRNLRMRTPPRIIPITAEGTITTPGAGKGESFGLDKSDPGDKQIRERFTFVYSFTYFHQTGGWTVVFEWCMVGWSAKYIRYLGQKLFSWLISY